MTERVSDERLAECGWERCGPKECVECAKCGFTMSLEHFDQSGKFDNSCPCCGEQATNDARAKLAAWEPVVRAAVEWWEADDEGPQRKASEVLSYAVDALPKEMRP